MTAPLPVPPAFSAQDYRRRWTAITDRLPALGLDATIVTSALRLGYAAGTNGGIHWTTPLILAPGQEPTWVVRRFDEDRVRVESPVPNVVAYYGEDDVVDVWADTMRSMGLARARVGMELGLWQLTPGDLDALRARLPGLEIADTSGLVGSVAAVKSDEELAVMRHAMTLTETAIEAFYEQLVVGATETEVMLATLGALLRAGSDYPSFLQTTLGSHTALPHARHEGTGAPAGLRRGDVAFAELAGFCRGYAAPLIRSAVVGRNARGEQFHAVADAAIAAAMDAARPGALTGDVYAAARAVIEGAGLGAAQRSRMGYQVGYDWGGRGDISLKPGGTDVIEPGMTFHLLVILFEPGGFSVGCSETILVTETAAERLATLPRTLRLL